MTLVKSLILSALVIGLLPGCASMKGESNTAEVSSPAVVAAPAPTATPGPPPAVAPEDFAILPWGSTAGDPELLAGIRECGFNLAGFVGPEALDAVQNAGLKGIVLTPSPRAEGANLTLSPAEIETRVRALTDKLGNHPAVYGYYLTRAAPSTCGRQKSNFLSS